jgi:hypothetical protein
LPLPNLFIHLPIFSSFDGSPVCCLLCLVRYALYLALCTVFCIVCAVLSYSLPGSMRTTCARSGCFSTATTTWMPFLNVSANTLARGPSCFPPSILVRSSRPFLLFPFFFLFLSVLFFLCLISPSVLLSRSVCLSELSFRCSSAPVFSSRHMLPRCTEAAEVWCVVSDGSRQSALRGG